MNCDLNRFERCKAAGWVIWLDCCYVSLTYLGSIAARSLNYYRKKVIWISLDYTRRRITLRKRWRQRLNIATRSMLRWCPSMIESYYEWIVTISVGYFSHGRCRWYNCDFRVWAAGHMQVKLENVLLIERVETRMDSRDKYFKDSVSVTCVITTS